MLRGMYLLRINTLAEYKMNGMKADTHKRVVIIGAGFAGLAAAQTLAENEDVEIVIVDRTNHHLFQPLLYQVATTTLTGGDISRSIRGLFANKANVSVVYDEAVDFNRAGKVVKMKSGNDLSYDYLILATGAKTSYFGQNHWAEHVFEMKALRDSNGIKASVMKNMEIAERSADADKEKLSTIAIVGGGPTGVELAGAFSDLFHRAMKKKEYSNVDPTQQKIILIEAQDFLLPPFHEKQREYTKNYLEKKGVDVRTGAMVANIEKEKITLKSGEVINAGTIIWGAGVEPSPLTRKLTDDLSPRGHAMVSDYLSLKDDSTVFCIGDLAAVSMGEGRWVPGVAPAANQEGAYVAKYILNEVEGGKKEVKPFEYFDKGKMAIIGKGAAVVDINGVQFQGWLGWMAWLFVHLMFLVGFRNRFTTLMGWKLSYLMNFFGPREFEDFSGDDEKA